MNPNPNKALWEKGDFTRIGNTMRESGEALVAGLGITKGLKVLDLGCGDGTTAIPAATLVAQILKISSAYSPPPPEGFVSPMTWGIEGNVIERFGGADVPKDRISFVRDTYTFNFGGTPAEFVEAFRRYYGPTMNAFDAA